MLCIRKGLLKESPDMQKDVKIGELLSDDNIRCYDDRGIALKEGYIPFHVSVIVRSAYSNKVLEETKDNKDIRYYQTVTYDYPTIHRGYDLLMYLSSMVILIVTKYSPQVDEVMMKSQFDVLGLYNPDMDLIDPIINTQVILKDDTVEKFEEYLKNDSYKMVDIKDMNLVGSSNILEIIRQIVIVESKEEESNE